MKIKCLSRLFVTLMFIAQAQALVVKNEQILLEKLSDYTICISNNYSALSCHEALERWVNKNPTNAFEAGHLVRQSMIASSAIPFFAKAFENGTGKCDEDVKLAVISGLNLPAESNSKTVSMSVQIAMNKCFNELKSELIENVTTENAFYLKNMCPHLKTKNILKGIKQKLCDSNSKT